MHHILVMMVMVMLLTGCASETGPKGQRELIPHPEKYAHDGYATLPDSLKPTFRPDTTVGQVSLMSTQNIGQYLGEDIAAQLADHKFARATVYSQDLAQRLTLYAHPDEAAPGFSAFKVDYAEPAGRSSKTVTNDQAFETESGVKLGMTVGDLRAIQGEPDSAAYQETTVFYYQLDSLENADLLRRYNQPGYSAEYTFSNGYLVEFKFGFY